MTDDLEAELRAAIVAAPDDDAPRLVYADWLTQRGNPRGELIVTSCEAERLDRRDPRRYALERRVRDLLVEHRSTLELAGCTDYRRGFPTRLTLDISAIHMLPSYLRHAPLETLEVKARTDRELVRLLDCELGTIQNLSIAPGRELRLDTAARLARWRGLAQLQTLIVRDAEYDGDALATLLASPHLRGIRTLHLHNGRVRELPTRALLGSTFAGALERLWLHGFDLDPGVHAMLGALPALRELSLYRSLPPEQLTALTAILPRLESLYVGSLGVDEELAARLPARGALRQLTIWGSNLFDDASLARLVRSPLVGTLEELHCVHCAVGPVGARALVDSGLLARLVRLGLEDRADDDVAEILAAAPAAAGLRQLWLGRAIRDRGARALAASPHLHDLGFLGLVKNPLSLDAARELRTAFGERVQLDGY